MVFENIVFKCNGSSAFLDSSTSNLTNGEARKVWCPACDAITIFTELATGYKTRLQNNGNASGHNGIQESITVIQAMLIRIPEERTELIDVTETFPLNITP